MRKEEKGEKEKNKLRTSSFLFLIMTNLKFLKNLFNLLIIEAKSTQVNEQRGYY